MAKGEEILLSGFTQRSVRNIIYETKHALRQGCFHLASLSYWAPAFGAAVENQLWSLVDTLSMSKIQLRKLFFATLTNQQLTLAKHYIEGQLGFDADNWTNLQDSNKGKNGILHLCIKGLWRENNFSVSTAVNFVKHLVDKDGTQLESRDKNGNTPLLLLMREFAAHSLSPAGLHVLPLLIKLGAKKEARDENDNNIFHLVQHCAKTCPVCDVYQGQSRKINLNGYIDLLNKFVGFHGTETIINSVNKKGESPLVSAINYFGELKVEGLNVYKSLGADFNLKDTFGNSILHVAVSKSFSTGFITKLMVCGSDPNLRNDKGKTALQLAIEKNDISLVNILVNSLGATVEKMDWKSNGIGISVQSVTKRVTAKSVE